MLQGAERHFIRARGAHAQLGPEGVHGLRARELQRGIKLLGLLLLAAREASSAATKCAFALRG